MFRPPLPSRRRHGRHAAGLLVSKPSRARSWMPDRQTRPRSGWPRLRANTVRPTYGTIKRTLVRTKVAARRHLVNGWKLASLEVADGHSRYKNYRNSDIPHCTEPMGV